MALRLTAAAHLCRVMARAFIAALACVCVTPVALAASDISGDYECVYGCRLTDAPPSLEVEGERAVCRNEFGGIFYGRMIASDLIACFNKTGRVLPDGPTIHWDGGAIWRRVR